MGEHLIHSGARAYRARVIRRNRIFDRNVQHVTTWPDIVAVYEWNQL